MSKENCREVSFEEIQKNEEINALIERGNAVLFALGYTEHSRKHASIAITMPTAGRFWRGRS